MVDNIVKSIPLVTRDAFPWGPSLQIDVEVQTLTYVTGDIQVSGMTKEGPFVFQIPSTGSGTMETTYITLSDYPIFFTIHTSDDTIGVTEIWASAFLRVNKTRLFNLANGHVSYQSPLSWPYQPINKEINELSKLSTVDSDSPAAGSEVLMTTDNNVLNRIRSVVVVLDTDATVANRRVHLQITDSADNVIYEHFPSIDQAANTIYRYVFTSTPHVADEFDNNCIVCAIPNNISLSTGMKIKTLTTNIQAGDQFTSAKAWGEVKTTTQV